MGILINLMLCGIIQVTIVAVVGLAAAGMCRRWMKMPGMAPLVAALSCVVILSLLVFSPWPSWLSRQRAATDTTTVATAPVSVDADQAGVTSTAQQEPAESGLMTMASAAWQSVVNDPAEVTASSGSTADAGFDATQSDWRRWMFWLFVIGIVVGLARLAGGLWAVNKFVASSRPVTNSKLRELVDVLCAELGCVRTVSLRESPRLATAATVGWRKPVVLISDSWKTWTRQQLRSVLAHEIAHIRRGDFTTAVLAQIGLVLHFYHPLVHSLVRRLRLEQELAADALAASIVGGSKSYLNAIGELALSQSSESMGWPAQAFLPTRRTFLRRIEMLRDLKTLTGRASRKLVGSTILAMAAVTLLVSGIRSPQSAQASVAEPTVLAGTSVASPTDPQARESLVAQYVPADAFIVAVAKPAELLAAFRKSIDANGTDEQKKQLAENPEFRMFGTMQQVTAILLTPSNPGDNPDRLLAVAARFQSKTDRDAAFTHFGRGRAMTPVTFQSVGYFVAAPEAFYPVDETTLIMGDEKVVQKMIATGGKSLSPLTDTPAWKDAMTGSGGIAVDATIIRKLAANAPLGPIEAMASPLWMATESHTLAISHPGDSIGLQLVSVSKSEPDAKRVEATLNAAIAMATSTLALQSGQPGGPPEEIVKTATAILDSHKITRDGSRVVTQISGDLTMLSAPLLQSISGARGAAQRAQQSNNQKQILLALHNYHDVYGSFPRAVTYDEATGTPRSWRVEILPFIEHAGLYEQYRKNEAWDSPANKAVLAQMPPVFRHPSQPKDATDTCITAACGSGLVFEEKAEKGMRIQDITDGTSNTIATLDGPTGIPWTKPEDIVIDVDALDLSKFGFDDTGFTVGFCDGSVRFISKTIDPAQFRMLLTRGGGEAINFDVPAVP